MKLQLCIIATGKSGHYIPTSEAGTGIQDFWRGNDNIGLHKDERFMHP